MHGLIAGVEQPKGLWCRRLAGVFPDLDIRVTGLVPLQGERFIETVELRGPGADEAVRRLRSDESLRHVAALDVAPDYAVVRMETVGCPLVNAMRHTGSVPQMPLRVLPGEDHWFIPGTEDEGGRFLDALTSSGLARRVLRAGDVGGPLDDLTPLQRETLGDAVRLGYYDYPRRISLTELARRRGVAKSTLSQTLRIVERKVMTAHVGGAVTATLRRGPESLAAREARPVASWASHA